MKIGVESAPTPFAITDEAIYHIEAFAGTRSRNCFFIFSKNVFLRFSFIVSRLYENITLAFVGFYFAKEKENAYNISGGQRVKNMSYFKENSYMSIDF